MQTYYSGYGTRNKPDQMNAPKKIIGWAVGIAASLYLITVLFFYFNQEWLLFHPRKLPLDHVFSYERPFKEMVIKVDSHTALSGLLFKTDSAKGLVIYLHGNSGALDTWGYAATPFLINDYDCFILDYRGFGKSQGQISSEEQLYHDVDIVYKELARRYDENQIVVVGYSIGTALAAFLAATNNPRQLILKAPYNNMNYMRELYYGWLPGISLKYPLTTDEHLKKVRAPIAIFHGDKDKLIPYECSLLLRKTFDNELDELIILKGQGHNGVSENEIYLKNVARILKR